MATSYLVLYDTPAGQTQNAQEARPLGLDYSQDAVWLCFKNKGKSIYTNTLNIYTSSYQWTLKQIYAQISTTL